MIINFFRNYSITPNAINRLLENNQTTPIHQSLKLIELLLRPQLSINKLVDQIPELNQLIKKIPNRCNEIVETAELLIKYEGYIERERNNAKKIERLEHILIPANFNFRELTPLSMEARLKLSKIKPKTIGHASRIPGISPSDINILLTHFGR